MRDFITMKIDLTKYPGDAVRVDEQGRTWMYLTMSEMMEPKYEDTHTIYWYDKEAKEKTYVGYAKKWPPRDFDKEGAEEGVDGEKMKI